MVFILIVACPLNVFSGDNKMNHEYLYKLVDELVLTKNLKIGDIDTALGIKLQKKEYTDPFLGGNTKFSIYEFEGSESVFGFSSIRVKIYSNEVPGWGVISFELAGNECISWKKINYPRGKRATIAPDAGGRFTSLVYKIEKTTINFRKQNETDCLFDVVINL